MSILKNIKTNIEENIVLKAIVDSVNEENFTLTCTLIQKTQKASSLKNVPFKTSPFEELPSKNDVVIILFLEGQESQPICVFNTSARNRTPKNDEILIASDKKLSIETQAVNIQTESFNLDSRNEILIASDKKLSIKAQSLDIDSQTEIALYTHTQIEIKNDITSLKEILSEFCTALLTASNSPTPGPAMPLIPSLLPIIPKLIIKINALLK